LGSNEPLGAEEAEQLIVRAATAGMDWIDARNTADLDRAATLADALTAIGEQKYGEFVRAMRDENNDRADLQAATLDRHLKNQVEKLEAAREGHIAAGRDSLAKAVARTIELLRQSVGLKRQRIESGRKLTSRRDEVCVGLIQVVNR
jgi:hypothetical protein